MKEMSSLEALICQLAIGGISTCELSQSVMQVYPNLSGADYQLTIFSLQESDQLIGQEVSGEWRFAAIDKTAPDYPHPEYSAEFAEKILAASCGEFVELEADDLISQLDYMIAKARSNDLRKGV